MELEHELADAIDSLDASAAACRPVSVPDSGARPLAVGHSRIHLRPRDGVRTSEAVGGVAPVVVPARDRSGGGGGGGSSGGADEAPRPRAPLIAPAAKPRTTWLAHAPRRAGGAGPSGGSAAGADASGAARHARGGAPTGRSVPRPQAAAAGAASGGDATRSSQPSPPPPSVTAGGGGASGVGAGAAAASAAAEAAPRRHRRYRAPDGEPAASAAARRPATLEESWQSLDFFSKHNRGRQLGTRDVSSLPLGAEGDADAALENVHFVNIDDSDSEGDVRGGGARPAPAPAPAPATRTKATTGASSFATAPAVASAAAVALRGGVGGPPSGTAAGAGGGAGRGIGSPSRVAPPAAERPGSVSAFNIPTLPRGQVLVMNIMCAGRRRWRAHARAHAWSSA